MQITRIEYPSDSGEPHCFVLDPRVAVVDASPSTTERLVSIVRDLYRGTKPEGRVFATIDGIEFEVNSDMVPLIGQRLDGAFDIIDLATAPDLPPDRPTTEAVHGAVARAALETVGAIPPTLDTRQLDLAAAAVDRSRDPLAEAAHSAYLQRGGLRLLFSRRSGRQLLDPNDPVVAQLARFDQVIADRRAQVSDDSPPQTDHVDRATDVMRELLSARPSGRSPETLNSLSSEAVANEIGLWMAQRHDRAVTPLLAERLERHAAGIDVVGSIPVVLDLRRVAHVLPGRDALRRSVQSRSDDLQFIALTGTGGARRWVEEALGSNVR